MRAPLCVAPSALGDAGCSHCECTGVGDGETTAESRCREPVISAPFPVSGGAATDIPPDLHVLTARCRFLCVCSFAAEHSILALRCPLARTSFGGIPFPPRDAAFFFPSRRARRVRSSRPRFRHAAGPPPASVCQEVLVRTALARQRRHLSSPGQSSRCRSPDRRDSGSQTGRRFLTSLHAASIRPRATDLRCPCAGERTTRGGSPQESGWLRPRVGARYADSPGLASGIRQGGGGRIRSG